MGAGNRRKNPGYAIGMIKQAITHKGINLNEKYFLLSQKYEKKESMERAYSLYSRFYNKLPNTSYDNTAYGYCRTCKYFNSNICEKLNIKTECTKACLYYNL
jgi:deoxyribodipyrimidine photolyase